MKRGEQIANGLLSLDSDTPRDNIAVEYRDLARNIKPAVCFYRPRKGQVLTA
jgi:hypothetical protein